MWSRFIPMISNKKKMFAPVLRIPGNNVHELVGPQMRWYSQILWLSNGFFFLSFGCKIPLHGITDPWFLPTLRMLGITSLITLRALASELTLYYI